MDRVRRAEKPRPALLQAMIDAFGQPDLRRRILITLGLLVVFRFVAHIPVPGVDAAALKDLFEKNQLIGMLNLFSGGAMRNMSIAAMGVYPYITAVIIMQLLTPVIPRLAALAKEGEAGRAKVNQYTHWLTVPLAAVQGYGQLVLMEREGVIANVGLSGSELLPTAAMVIVMVAGTMFLVWLGELITEYGIGNGVSMIIFGGIVAGLPQQVGQGYIERGNMGGLAFYLVLALALVVLIVVFTEAHRRIPVQYARSVFRGGRMYRQSGATHVPIRVNSAGMIPLIFGMSLVILPGTVASYFVAPGGGGVAGFIYDLFSATSWFYWLLFGLLVIGFAFFYTMVIFQQQNLAETLQRQGAFVPGIRPGRPTAQYFNRVITKITWGGAIFLGVVAISPYVMRNITGIKVLAISSTAIIIMVGVALDTMRQLESQLLMRRYEGFLK